VNEGRIWWLDSAELSSAAEASLAGLLSPDELARQAGFRHESRRREFGIGRALARKMLGQALGCDPKALVFESGHRGKPQLVGQSLDIPGFNIAHSEGLIVVALCDRGDIGVDVLRSEQVVRDHRVLTKRYFSEPEATWVLGPESEKGRQRFLSLFTQKEARLKLSGEGLARPLNEVPVLLQTSDFQHPRALLQGLDPDLGTGFLSAATSHDVTGWRVLPIGISEGLLKNP
jgi:4'-phosphopantetheinyl transferase